jgi:hypothetical protein
LRRGLIGDLSAAFAIPDFAARLWTIRALAAATSSNMAFPKTTFRTGMLCVEPVNRSQAASSDAEITHHAVLLMLDDVTMKHPVAGIIGDKGDLGRLVGQKKQRICMVLGSAQFV